MARRHHPIRNPHPALKLVFFLIGAILVLAGIVMLWIALTPTPDLASFENRKETESTQIYDRTGKVLLYDLDTDARRVSVPLTDISPDIRNATVAIEDAGFYQHGGISVTGIIRSFLADIFSGSYSQGGSTITQQVVKNTLLTGDKSITRKVHEWILAIKLEQVYSKDQILEFYLNDTPYGGPYYGVEAASEAYFGVSAKDVDLAQAAYLAALPQAPTYYSPYGQNRAELDARKNLVLDRMQQLGYISAAEATAAKAEVVTFRPQSSSSIIAPHFVFYIEQYLESKYGPDAIDGGLKVITTLDTTLQADAEASVAQFAPGMKQNFQASNTSVVAVDPKTGQILAMVGSEDYFNADIDGSYNDTISERQPGSAFKPFVYAAALEKGYTPDTAIFDLPTQFSTACAPTDNYNDTPPCYAPSDYDNKFRGPMTFTTALAQSINVPAVKVLYLAGVQNVIDLATASGITTLGNPSQYGLSLALGAAEVKLLDLVDAYGTFADGGVHNPPTGILSVTDASGNVLEQYQPQETQVMDSSIAAEISSMLSNNAARYPEYPADNPLNFPSYDVAVKTGTTNDSRDAWTVGYTPSIVIGAWAGNNDNTPMVKEIAGYIVAPMWHDIMAKALGSYPQEYFPEPPAPPADAPPPFYGNYVVNGAAHELLYSVNKSNPLGGPPANPAADPQFAYWEYPVAQWAAANPADIIEELIQQQGTTTSATENTTTDSSASRGRGKKRR